MYPGYIRMTNVPCTPPLLLLDLVKILVHLSPQLWDFIMCTLVHWYTGTLAIVYPGYIASGTLVHLYPGTLSCTMYPCTPPLLLLGLSQNLVHLSPQLLDFIMCTLVHWQLCTLGTLLLVHWYIFTLVHCHVPCTHVPMYPCTPPLLLLGL